MLALRKIPPATSKTNKPILKIRLLITIERLAVLIIFLNESIILSILFRALRSQVRLILIDPKKVEFTPYAKIPHLACPVVNDTTKAAATLKKLVEVMEERYTKFSENSVRNIEEYNHKNSNNY